MIIDKIITEIFETVSQKKYTISTIESCTGGGVASYFTKVSGASTYFRGAIVTYQNESKETFLNIDKNWIEENGVVSDNMIEKMLIGGSKHFGTDIVMATTGVLGPNTDDQGNKVGNVWIGVSINGKIYNKELMLKGDRAENHEETCKNIFIFLLKILQELDR